MIHIPVATEYMVILGRIYADGSEADYKIVNALQEQLKVTPLSAWGTEYAPIAPAVDPNPGFSMTDEPQTVLLNMDADAYFNMMSGLMCKTAPPATEDAPVLAEMAKIGIEPCKEVDLSKLDADAQAVFDSLPKEGLDAISAQHDSLGEKKNGWVITTGLGDYGTNYMKRAVVAAFGWPANRQEDAVYPYTDVDSAGNPLTGAHKYTLTFAKDEQPPVNAFWSITMYEIDKGWWFTPNSLNKFTVSPRDNLVANADGSITLYFQHESPGKDKEANWLPAPEGAFLPMLRMYWPKAESPSILDGSWTPPAVQKAD